ncbi:MAG: TetR/AcrR family transcriptional regulator [Spirochaetaceae bacterium]|nr:TetR/AcrR family transcriptional regulator [Spirochaetaceae bacterium]
MNGTIGDGAATRDRIVAAARTLFARRGYKGTTTRAIAVEAGLNEVTIFRTLGSKERILYEILASSFPNEAEAPLARLLERPVEDGEGLGRLLTGFSEVFLGSILTPAREIVLIAIKEADGHPEFRELLEERARGATQLLAGRLRELEDEGLVMRGAAGPVAELFAQALIGRFILVRGEPDPVVSAFAEVLARGMTGDPPPRWPISGSPASALGGRS